MKTNSILNTRICQKIDIIDNWESSNPILLKGEIGLVVDGKHDIRVKVGDGTTHFIELPYADTKGYIDGESSDISVINISKTEYEQLVLTPGAINTSALYVVSSDVLDAYGERVVDVAEPELSSDAATKNYVDVEISKIDATSQIQQLSSALSSKINVAYTKDGDFEPTSLSVRVVKLDEYASIVSSNAFEDGVLYSISGLASLDAFNQAISNVGDPTLSNDAATKNYVDTNCSKCLMRVWTEEE